MCNFFCRVAEGECVGCTVGLGGFFGNCGGCGNDIGTLGSGAVCGAGADDGGTLGSGGDDCCGCVCLLKMSFSCVRV